MVMVLMMEEVVAMVLVALVVGNSCTDGGDG